MTGRIGSWLRLTAGEAVAVVVAGVAAVVLWAWQAAFAGLVATIVESCAVDSFSRVHNSPRSPP